MLSQRISGAKLRRVREQRCLTVAAIADAVGRTPSNIYKIEQGKAQPSPPVYAALKAVLEVGDSELVDEAAGTAA
ncbi:helix-turn-helix transcriptional regulator [Streptomyces sp. NPDC005760]|uniref:helix-turn-helix domain-containing protein n=1 Tax=Streptomyces sp. NPDC005760 TaxID=3156718 RepID=UPI0033E3DEDF